MVKHPLPEWTESYSQLIDQGIEEFIHSVRLEKSVDLFLPLIKEVTLRGRKLRSNLALRYVHWQGFETKNDSYNKLVTALSVCEILHAVSCVIDDIIDGDSQRRNVPAFHIREGMPQAQLIALEAIVLPTYLSPEISKYLINATRLMFQGEACDSFDFDVIEKLITHGSVDELLNLYILKTTPLFIASHKIINSFYSLDQEDSIKAYADSLGRFYQYANDFHDTFSIPLNVRGNSEEKARLNLSMPLALALKYDYGFYGGVIGKTMYRSNINNIIKKMVHFGVHNEAKQLLMRTKDEVISNYPGKKTDELPVLLETIGSKEFWCYSYGK